MDQRNRKELLSKKSANRAVVVVHRPARFVCAMTVRALGRTGIPVGMDMVMGMSCRMVVVVMALARPIRGRMRMDVEAIAPQHSAQIGC